MIEVIIDGANVASINGTSKRLAKRIETALGHLDPIVDCVKAVLPSYWMQKKEKKVIDPDILEKIVREEKIITVNRNDDYFMIKYCVKKNAYLLTNDKLRNHREKKWWTPKYDEWVKTHLLDYEVINDILLLSEKSERILNQASLFLQNSDPRLELEAE